MASSIDGGMEQLPVAAVCGVVCHLLLGVVLRPLGPRFNFFFFHLVFYSSPSSLEKAVVCEYYLTVTLMNLLHLGPFASVTPSKQCFTLVLNFYRKLEFNLHENCFDFQNVY